MTLPKLYIKRATDPLYTKFAAKIGDFSFDESDLPTIRIHKRPNSPLVEVTILATSDLPHDEEIIIDINDSDEYQKTLLEAGE